MLASALFLIAAVAVDTGQVIPDTITADSAARALATRALGAAPQAPQRRKAVDYSEWYGRRLTLHRWGSYAMLPLFGTEYVLGNKLLNDETVSSSTRDTHAAVASALGVLFVANTATGLWNLWDARHDPNGRGKRLVHSAFMLAADAGFLYTASLAEDDGNSHGGIRHRNAALASIGLSTVGTGLMWFFKD